MLNSLETILFRIKKDYFFLPFCHSYNCSLTVSCLAIGKMPPSAANFTYAAFYGEPYLRRLHQEGYPVNEYLKRDFSTRFYDDNNLTQAERSRASNFVASLTQSIRVRYLFSHCSYFAFIASSYAWMG